MASPSPQRRYSFDQWLRRLDRAARVMNPYLTVLAIGLAILNLTCIALLAPRLVTTRETAGLAACQPPLDCPIAASFRGTGHQ